MRTQHHIYEEKSDESGKSFWSTRKVFDP